MTGLHSLVCPTCGEPFPAVTAIRGEFCSLACWAKAHGHDDEYRDEDRQDREPWKPEHER